MRLMVWDASCILRNYEVRTKQVITPEQLQDGSLADLLVDSDYDLEQSVSTQYFPQLPTFSPPAVRKEEFLVFCWSFTVCRQFRLVNWFSLCTRGIVRTRSRDFRLSPILPQKQLLRSCFMTVLLRSPPSMLLHLPSYFFAEKGSSQSKCQGYHPIFCSPFTKIEEDGCWSWGPLQR